MEIFNIYIQNKTLIIFTFVFTETREYTNYVYTSIKIIFFLVNKYSFIITFSPCFRLADIIAFVLVRFK